MKVGLYFGSFNPIHIGHLIIANHVLNNTDVKKVWFIVSPHNPLKESATLIDEYKRLNLVRTAIENDPRFKASDIEFGLPRPRKSCLVKSIVIPAGARRRSISRSSMEFPAGGLLQGWKLAQTKRKI